MQFKAIVKSLLLTYLCSSAYAAPAKDNCKEIKDYLTSNKASSLVACNNNSNGEVTELKLSNDDNLLTNEDIKKILSYNTIKKFDFNEEQTDCAILNNGISNLQSLEELNIKSFRGGIAPNVLKDLKSLKSLTYDAGDYNYGKLTQENINNLSTLSNLEKIKLAYVSVDESLNFSPLNGLKVSSLTLETNGKSGIKLKGLVNNLKNLKELTISSFVPSQEEVDAITSSNIEKLTIELDEDIKTDNFKNLKNLTSLDLTMEGVKEVPGFVNSLPNLKTAKFNGKEVSLKNGNGDNGSTAVNGENNINGVNGVTNGNAVNGTATNGTTANDGSTDATSDAKILFIRSISYLPFLVLYLIF